MPQTYRKKPKITRKQKALVHKVIGGKTQAAAYKEVYDTKKASPVTVRTEAYKVLHKPNVQEYMQQALAKHDLTVDRALDVISRSLGAQKVNEYTGEITDDLTTQLKASDRVLKLHGISGNDNKITGNTFLTFVNQAQDRYTQD